MVKLLVGVLVAVKVFENVLVLVAVKLLVGV